MELFLSRCLFSTPRRPCRVSSVERWSNEDLLRARCDGRCKEITSISSIEPFVRMSSRKKTKNEKKTKSRRGSLKRVPSSCWKKIKNKKRAQWRMGVAWHIDNHSSIPLGAMQMQSKLGPISVWYRWRTGRCWCSSLKPSAVYTIPHQRRFTGSWLVLVLVHHPLIATLF